MSTKEERKIKEQELIRAESIRLESERKIDQEMTFRGLKVDIHHFKIESKRVKGVTILTLDKSKVSREQLGEMIYKTMWEVTRIYGKILAHPLKILFKIKDIKPLQYVIQVMNSMKQQVALRQREDC